MDVLYTHCAGLDFHKKTVVVCCLTPGPAGALQRETRTFGTMTPDLLRLVVWLTSLGIARIAELSAAGFSDPVIAERLSHEGFRSSRQTSIPPSLVTRIRRSQGQVSVRGQFRSQPKLGGAWTVWGLARHVDVPRDWLYRRMAAGRLAAERHPVAGQYLIADDPVVLAALQAEVDDQRSRVIHVEPIERGGPHHAEKPEPAHD